MLPCGYVVALSLVPALLSAQFAVVSPGHSQSHVDLQVGDTTRLAVNREPTQKTTWKSGNSTVVSVSTTGKLTAKKRGYATIKAVRGADTATIRACVTLAPAETIAASSLKSKRIAVLSDGDLWHPNEPRSFTAVDSLSPSTAWGSCLHWFSRTEGVTVDSVGRYTIPMRVDPTKPLPFKGFPNGASYLQVFTPFAVLGPQYLGAPVPFRGS